METASGLSWKQRFLEDCETVVANFNSVYNVKQQNQREAFTVLVRTLVASLKQLRILLDELDSLISSFEEESKSDVSRQREVSVDSSNSVLFRLKSLCKLEKSLVEGKLLLADALSKREEVLSKISSMKRKSKDSGDGKITFGSYKGSSFESQLTDDSVRRLKSLQDRALASEETVRRARHLAELQALLVKEQEKTNEILQRLEELEASW
eukprot:ctg_273.g156